MEIEKLPERWKRVRLGEVIKETLPGEWGNDVPSPNSREVPVISTLAIDYDGKIDFEKFVIRYILKRKINKLRLRYGDICIEKSGGSTDKPAGKVAYVKKDWNGTCSNFIQIIRVDPAQVVNKFLFFRLLHDFKNNLTEKFQQKTTGIINFKLKEYLRDKLYLPPLPEQRKIAEILETVDNAIEKTDRIIEKHKRIKQGLMQDLLTRGIDENGQIRSEETHKFKDSPLGRIPEEWGVSRIIDFSRTKSNPIQTGPFGAQLHAFEYVKDGVPLILIKNIFEGKIIEKNIPHILEKKAMKLKRYRLKSGDVVFSRVGNVGRCAVIKDKQNGWLISGQMLRVRLENPLLDPIFLSYMMDTVWFQKVLESEILGTTRKSINTDILSKLPIILPSLPEQHRIAEILSQIDETIKKEQKYKEKLERIKHGLMEDLLTGKVRVNHLIEKGVENVS